MGLFAFYRSSVGKKLVVAATGLAMVGFLTAHMLGNLQIYAGRGPTPETTRLNEYAELLRMEPGLLWAARLGLLAALLLHVGTTIQLQARNRSARPVGYRATRSLRATPASRTMLWGGIAILFFVVYHLLHFTTGQAHAELFTPGDVYENVVRSFSRWEIALAYVAAQIALFFHLGHGFQSALRTIGVEHPGRLAAAVVIGRAFALALTVGFVSVPIAVLAGWVR